MVGRSKPRKKMDLPKPEVDFYTAENLYLKAKNQELAKALAETKNSYSLMIEERDLLQRELFSSNLRGQKLENCIKEIDASSRASINSIVSASNHITEVLQATNKALNMNRASDIMGTSLRGSMFNGSAHSSPGLPNKTQAVKPMIDGHVIFRPTISLRRVNEIPLEEIRRMQSGLQTQTTSHNGNATPRDDEAENQAEGINNLCLSRARSLQQAASESENNEGEDAYMDQADVSGSDDALMETDNRLDTLHEEDDENDSTLPSNSHLTPLSTTNTSLNISGTSPQVPLLSGVFRDVRVYLSPMQNMGQYLNRRHVTTERGSSKSHKSKGSSRTTDNSTRASNTAESESRKTFAQSAQSSPINSNGSLDGSLDQSNTSIMQTSLLSSTKIATPNATGLPQADAESHSCCRPSARCDASLSQTGFGTNNASSYNDDSLRWTNHGNGSEAQFLSRTSCSMSSNKILTSTIDYDPLEGPSTMLDSFENETENKLEIMNGLGLTPRFLENNKAPSRTPSSPAKTVLQRRERLRLEDGTPPKSKISINVTKRKAIEKKKSSIISTKVAKVVLNRLSTTQIQLSNSPSKRGVGRPQKDRNFLAPQSNSSTPRNHQRNDDSPDRADISTSSVRRRLSMSMSPQIGSPSESHRLVDVPRSSEKSSVKKQGKEPKIAAMATRSGDSPRSPKLRRVPRRAAQMANLKEPSLVKKLRRSK